MDEEEDSGISIPEWVVTFGDMMSLLLTFFIMLVSLSEIKQQERFHAIVQSFQKRMGYTTADVDMLPGPNKPRNARLSKPATLGRAKRFNAIKGGIKTAAPVGKETQVRNVRPGTPATDPYVVVFSVGSTELRGQDIQLLQQHAAEIGGKPQKIEIRGHTAPVSDLPVAGLRDNWDLAYQRCRAAMGVLLRSGIDRRRIRMTVAGPHEPFRVGDNPVDLKKSPRVEIYLLEEVVQDLEGPVSEQPQTATQND